MPPPILSPPSETPTGARSSSCSAGEAARSSRSPTSCRSAARLSRATCPCSKARDSWSKSRRARGASIGCTTKGSRPSRHISKASGATPRDGSSWPRTTSHRRLARPTVTVPAGLEPIHVRFDVDCDAQQAFNLWTARTSLWWPVSHTVSTESGLEVIFEPRPADGSSSGRPTGTEHDWGEILEWEPPRRLVYLWHLRADRADATEVEIRFTTRPMGTAGRDRAPRLGAAGCRSHSAPRRQPGRLERVVAALPRGCQQGPANRISRSTAASRRSFSSRERTVRRRWPRNGLAGPNVRGTMPARSRPSAACSAASLSPIRTSRKLQMLGQGCQPQVGEPRHEPLPLGGQCLRVRATVGGRRECRVLARWAEMVEMLPGGRTRSSLSITDRSPTAVARLAPRPERTPSTSCEWPAHSGTGFGASDNALATELEVRLVDNHERRRRQRRRRVEHGLDEGRGPQRHRLGCWASTARRRRPLAARAMTASTSSAKASSPSAAARPRPSPRAAR